MFKSFTLGIRVVYLEFCLGTRFLSDFVCRFSGLGFLVEELRLLGSGFLVIVKLMSFS